MIDPAAPNYTFVLPTYRRPDTLSLALDHLAKLDYDLSKVEVRVYDNGAPQESRSVAESFSGKLKLAYTLNEPGHGLGYSLMRGAREAAGTRIVELNDDALVPPDFLTQLDAAFASESRIGIVGVRALEAGYAEELGGIGAIDSKRRRVIGNFHRPTEGLKEVEHVYGFCYAYTRALLQAGGGHDQTLLAKDYSSGNRIETDQCLTAKRLGFRVVYDGRIEVVHLAKPRGDMSERSLRWRVNEVRNTLYLYLKHFGLFGRQGLALRYTLLHDPGLRSAILTPTRSNLGYFYAGLRARLSAFWHYGLFRLGL